MNANMSDIFAEGRGRSRYSGVFSLRVVHHWQRHRTVYSVESEVINGKTRLLGWIQSSLRTYVIVELCSVAYYCAKRAEHWNNTRTWRGSGQ